MAQILTPITETKRNKIMLTLEQAYEAQEQLQDKINSLGLDLQNITNDPEQYISSVDFNEQYDEMLDEVHGEFMGYSASRILEEVDPTAYRVGLSDFISEYDAESSEEYTEAQEQLEELQAELEEIEEEIEELEADDEE